MYVQKRQRGRLLILDVPVILAIITVVVVTGLWMHNHGVSDLGRHGSQQTSIGRLTGLWCADLLLIQVLMLARIPWLEKRYGQDQLTRWHRWSGLASFWLLIAHLVFIVVGYASTVHKGIAAQTWDLVWNYPGMLLATAATLMIFMVVATSIKISRKKLRYESWHLLHLYAYLGVGLAIPHQLWAGTEFSSSPALQEYFWILYAAAAGSILLFRVILPLYRNAHHSLKVEKVVPESADVVSVYLRGKNLRSLGAKAGQYFVWRFADGKEGWSQGHPFSLSSVPSNSRIRITVKNLGDGSRRVRGLKVGTRAYFEGPLGRFTGDVYRGGGVTFMAAGVGVTPIRALIEELPYRPGQGHLLYRVKSEEEIIFRREIDAISKERGLNVVYLPGKPARSGSWMPSGISNGSDGATLRSLVPDIANHDIYMCGPPVWMDAARAAALKNHVPTHHIHDERFGW